MKETVLLYNIQDKERLNKLKKALIPLGMRLKIVKREEYSHPVGYLAGVKGIAPSDTPYEGEEFGQEMMVLAGLGPGRLDASLIALKKAGVGRIHYKAILTKTNSHWDSVTLYRELAREHEAVTGQKEVEKMEEMTMKYRKFGNTGVEVSALGFGCMRLPIHEDKTIDEETAIAMIRRAIDGGVNYVDTAYPYHQGTSELLVAKALKDGYREKTFLADKLPVWLLEKEEDFDRYLDEQLTKLETDHIDFYLLHALSRERFEEKVKKFDLTKKMEAAKAAGKIRYLGFSFHDSLDVFKEIVDYYSWDFCQIQYNYINTDYQAGTEGLRYAASKGLGVVVMEPLLGGKLSNLADHVSEAMSGQKSQTEYALDFIWDQPEVSLLLSGMSLPEQVERNLEYASRSSVGMVTEEEKAMYQKAKEIFDRMALVNCTKCAYCMPCPFGLNIPELFAAYNMTASSGMAKAKEAYGALETKADACRACHHCEKECPQHIKISETMPKVAAAFV